MTIDQIKQSISAKTSTNLVALNMVRQLEEDKETPTKWVSHWDNEARIRVVMHEDVLATYRANKQLNTFAYKYTLVEAEDKGEFDNKGEPIIREAYHRFTIITPKNIEEVI